jgi:hypothetical protein
MKRIRFSIGSLLVAVLAAGVGFAALRESTDVWDSGVFTVAVASFLLAALLALHREGPRRAFWLGFALFGGTYLVASLLPSVESRLLTSRGLVYLDSKVPRESVVTWLAKGTRIRSGAGRVVAFAPDGRLFAESTQRSVRLWDLASGKLLAGPDGSSENFVRIGHSLLALLLGCLGGLLSRSLFAGRAGRGEPTRDESTDHPDESRTS